MTGLNPENYCRRCKKRLKPTEEKVCVDCQKVLNSEGRDI